MPALCTLTAALFAFLAVNTPSGTPRDTWIQGAIVGLFLAVAVSLGGRHRNLGGLVVDGLDQLVVWSSGLSALSFLSLHGEPGGFGGPSPLVVVMVVSAAVAGMGCLLSVAYDVTDTWRAAWYRRDGVAQGGSLDNAN